MQGRLGKQVVLAAWPVWLANTPSEERLRLWASSRSRGPMTALELSALFCQWFRCLDVEVQVLLNLQQIPHLDGVVAKEKDQAPVSPEGRTIRHRFFSRCDQFM